MQSIDVEGIAIGDGMEVIQRTALPCFDYFIDYANHLANQRM